MNTSPYLLPALIIGCLYAFGQYISSQPTLLQDRSLTVQATGVINSVPDTAHIMLGVQVQPQATAAQATDMLAKQANAVIDALKNMGIKEADIKTQNVSVQPTYDYADGKQTIRGYEGNEQLDVTVRDTAKSGDIIARATEAGANQIGGLTFKAEDSDSAQLAAEKSAIENARKKAEELADSLRVRLGRVKQYNVSPNYNGPMPYALEQKAVGMGGDASVTSPRIPVGTQEHSVTVTITYGIR